MAAKTIVNSAQGPDCRPEAGVTQISFIGDCKFLCRYRVPGAETGNPMHLRDAADNFGRFYVFASEAVVAASDVYGSVALLSDLHEPMDNVSLATFEIADKQQQIAQAWLTRYWDYSYAMPSAPDKGTHAPAEGLRESESIPPESQALRVGVVQGSLIVKKTLAMNSQRDWICRVDYPQISSASSSLEEFPPFSSSFTLSTEVLS